jgi:hypothetical protein
MTPIVYPCPVCEVEMAVKPFERGIGWKYECRGSEDNRHIVQLYVRTEFPESSVVGVRREKAEERVAVARVGEKTESLLERVRALSGKGE